MRTKTAKPAGIKNPLEGTIEGTRDFGRDLGKTVSNDLVKGGFDEIWNELLGVKPLQEIAKVSDKSKPESAESTKAKGGVVFDAKLHKGEASPAPKIPEQRKKPEARKDAHINYHAEIANSSERAVQKKNKTIGEQIAEKQAELQRLAKEMPQGTVDKQGEATVNLYNIKAGVGTFNFLDFIATSFQDAKRKAGDSDAWLKASKGKNAKKGAYDPSNGMQHSTGEKTTIQNAAG